MSLFSRILGSQSVFFITGINRVIPDRIALSLTLICLRWLADIQQIFNC